jgi:hypothetical protein
MLTKKNLVFLHATGEKTRKTAVVGTDRTQRQAESVWRNWNGGIGMAELVWQNWYGGIDMADWYGGIDMAELVWRNRYGGIGMAERKALKSICNREAAIG